MGDRYYLTLDCAYCGEENTVYYAPSSGIETFDCAYCEAQNRIVLGFSAEGIDEHPNADDI